MTMKTRKLPPAVSRATTSTSREAVIPRRFARAAVDLPAQYALEGEPVWHTSIIDDLGGGGVRLQTQEDVAAGSVVSLRFDIEGMPIRATARVAMSLFDKSRERFVHGVAFTAIDPQQQATIVKRVVVLQRAKE
jgi:hypothetical protein